MKRLLLLLGRFSRVRLCATPWTAAHQAPPSLGFSRQEHWSGLPFPSPMHESEVAQSCSTLRDPMDCSLPGSSIHGIFQVTVLEWGCHRLLCIKRQSMQKQSILRQWKGPSKYTQRTLQNTETSCCKNVTFFSGYWRQDSEIVQK